MSFDQKTITISHCGKMGSCDIKEFGLNNMADYPSIVMVGKRGSGICDLLNHKLKKENTILTIFSPNDKMTNFYENKFPNANIYHAFSSNVIKSILEEQKVNIQQKNGIEHIVVMDDCIAAKGDLAKDLAINELLFNGRHYHITCILTMQFPLGIKPELRCNFDYVFLLADDIISNQKRIFQHYAGIFPNYESFRQVFVQLTSDYGSMVIVNRHSDEQHNFLDKIFYFKATDYGVNDPSKLNKIGSFPNENDASDASDVSDVSDVSDDNNANDDKSESESVISDESASESSCSHIFEIKEKIVVKLLKEFNFKNTLNAPIYFVVGENKKLNNLAIKKILDFYLSKQMIKDITHIKNDFEYDVLKQIITKQDLNNEKTHFVVFDGCFNNFDSFSNKKKCALFELFLRNKELNVPIIIQTSEKINGLPEFIIKSIDYMILSKMSKILYSKLNTFFYNKLENFKNFNKHFKNVFAQITEDLSAMVINFAEDKKISYLSLVECEDRTC